MTPFATLVAQIPTTTLTARARMARIAAVCSGIRVSLIARRLRAA